MLKILSSLILLSIGGVLVFVLWPLPKLTPRLAKGDDASAVPPETRSIIMDHGKPTEEVYVLLHGLTNCPPQFRKFGELLYASGANVMIPRMPFHGYRDRMTEAHAQFDAPSMMAAANEAVQFAKKFGKRITVIGLSVNGVTAAWLAQENPDVDRAILFSPFFAPKGMAAWAILPATNLLCRLPNFFIWWDSTQKEKLGGSPYSYPRFATRSIGETMRLGREVFASAGKNAPKARQILVVTTGYDLAISNPRVEELVELWKKTAPDRIHTYQFPEEWKVPHDFIDPWQLDQQVDKAYPVLLEQLDKIP